MQVMKLLIIQYSPLSRHASLLHPNILHFALKQSMLFTKASVTKFHTQAGSGAHPASYTMGTEGVFSGGKTAGK
jgi:hypothetical protein